MNPLEAKKVHFIGIGGIGVSSLARWYLAHGAEVSGSDLAPSELTDDLRKSGVSINVGHAAEHIPAHASLVIYSQAAKSDNQERKAAELRGIPMISYPEAIGELTRRYATIGVAGAHGKSTTTALLTLSLIEAGMDPTVIIGTKLRELNGSNFRAGKSEFLILEADEYGRAFHNYHPAGSIVTNIDLEHVDIYPDLDAIKQSFLHYMGQVRRFLILNYDDANLRSIEPQITQLAAQKGLQIFWYSAHSLQAHRIRSVIKLSGDHNVSNATGVYAAAHFLGASDEAIFKALSSYEGAWRRMEYRGKYKKALVYDDYGHHPTEIKATLQAFKEKFPDKEILCVFQPHQAERLMRLFTEFQTAFDLADKTLILPSYKVAGRDAEHPDFTAEKLARAIQLAQPTKKLFYLADPDNLTKALDTLDDLPNTVIVMMGAGDIVKLTNLLVS